MASTPMVTGFKLKQTPTDVWSIRERLCLASSVMRSGDQNWMSVSRAIKPYGEPNRPADWFSQKNCALQYSDLLEKVETPKRKRGERGEIETPGESIVRKLTMERIEELKKLILQEQQEFYRLKEELEVVIAGHADERLHAIWENILEERKVDETKMDNHQKWLQDREAAKQAAALEMRNRKLSTSTKSATPKRLTANRQPSHLDPECSSEPPVADSTIPDIKEEPSTTQEVGNNLPSSSSISSITSTGSSVTAAASIPSPIVSSTHHHSPLLNTLLRSSTHVSQSNALASLKERNDSASPMVSSFLLPIGTSSSSSVSLLTTALSGPHEHHHDSTQPTARSPVTSHSQGKLPPLPVVVACTEEVVAISTPPLNTVPSSTEPEIISVVEEIVPTIKTEIEDEENVDVLMLHGEDPVIESTVENVLTCQVEEEVATTENIPEIKQEVKETEEVNEDDIEIIVTEESMDKESSITIDVQEEVCSETTPAEDVYTEVVETEVGEEPTSSGDVCSQGDISVEDVIEVVEDTSTVEVEDMVPTTTEQVTVETQDLVCEVKTETERTEVNSQKECEVTDEEVTAEPAVEVSSRELEVPKSEESEVINVTCVTDDSSKPSTEDANVDVKVENLNEVKEEKESEKAEDTVVHDDSVTCDDSESNISKPEEKAPRRRRTKKWAVGISRRTSTRTAAGQSATLHSEDSTTAEIKENSTTEQLGVKKSKKETADISKQKRETGVEEPSTPSQSLRTRRSNVRRTKENQENTSDTDLRGKLRNRRQARNQEQTKTDEEDAEEDVKNKEGSSEKKTESSDESKERVEKDDSIVDVISEAMSIETEEESKEGTASRTGVPNDSVPNSPASTSFSGDDVESIRDYKVWKKAIMLVWRAVANHKYANVFLNAVTEEMAPGYQSVVYRPMDLATVKKSIENQTVRTTMEFQRDVLLIFQNAIMYNNSDHDVYKMAVEMQQEVIMHIQDFLATQLMVQSNSLQKSLRRETRDHAHKTRESLEKSFFSIIQENDHKRKRPASESDSGSVQTSKRRRTRANDD
ncbi:Bromodomain-containing protein 8 [Chamberlinius hualienensis]